MRNHATERQAPRPVRVVRGTAGGVLMGLANLVPGISGGTMLLAAGVYPDFIDAVADLTRFRFRPRPALMLACIVGGMIAAIVGLAGPMSHLVIDHRWIMYSLFIGLTLGGVPILWPMVRPLRPPVVVLAVSGIGVMAAMALLVPGGASAGGGAMHPTVMYVAAGLAASSAMVLPGVSGGYLLLVLGQYVAILTAVATLKDGIRAGDWSIAADSLSVLVPVGLGAVVGVAFVSNLVRVLLDRWRRATVSVLLGLLLGAVIGIWPFQEGRAPEVGSPFRGDTVVLVEGELVMEHAGRPIEPQDYETAFFAPTGLQMIGALALIAVGFAATTGVARFADDSV